MIAALAVTFAVSRAIYYIAGIRYDCWFRFEGFWWWGVRYGNNTEIVHCKRTKETV